MYDYKNEIIESIAAEKILALRLEKALKGVGEEAHQQLGRINDGFTRLTWYSSCISDNY